MKRKNPIVLGGVKRHPGRRGPSQTHTRSLGLDQR